DYLVFWTEDREPSLVHAVAARVRASDGVVLDSTERPLLPDASGRWNPRLAFSGGQYLAVWKKDDSGVNSRLEGLRLARDGTPIDTAPRTIAPTADYLESSSLAGDGQNVLVAWSDVNGAKARRVRMSDFAVLD